MFKEINYHDFSCFLKGKFNLENEDIKKSIAANILVNWDSLAYYGHTKSDLTLHEISEHALYDNELTFNLLRYLISEKIVKKSLVKCKETNNIFVYYTLSDNFHCIKNDYIYRYESERWNGFKEWELSYNIYVENKEFYDEIEYSLKYWTAFLKHTESSFNKANYIKNDYILKISTECDYDKRFQLKEEALSKIEYVISNR